MANISTLIKGATTVVKNPKLLVSGPKFGVAVLTAKKHAPTIAVYSGVAGMVVSTVLACRETFEAHHAHSMATSERIRMKKFVEANPNSQEADSFKRDLTLSYAKESLALVKIYGPALSVGALSIASIAWGHNTLQKRHAAVVAAYSAVQASYNEYRERVTEALGVDAERAIREEMVKENSGDLDYSKAPTGQVDTKGLSPYARVFDETNDNWTDDASYNQFFLRSAQNYANDLLHARGYVFLNEVYKQLGIPATRTGQVVGWVLNNRSGDGYIDFGIFDAENPGNVDFLSGFEKSTWLDFNVDGAVLDLIDIRKI